MSLKPEEISWVIEQEIERYSDTPSLDSFGLVLRLESEIARVWGLEGAMMSELVEFCNGTTGIVLNLGLDYVGVILLGSSSGITERSTVKGTGKIAEIPVGEASRRLSSTGASRWAARHHRLEARLVGRPLLIDERVLRRGANPAVLAPDDAVAADDALEFAADALDGGPGAGVVLIGPQLDSNAPQRLEGVAQE